MKVTNIKTKEQGVNLSERALLKKAMQKKVLKKVLTQINQGGLTYCPLSNKDYGGTQHIAISPFPERSEIFSGKATDKTVTNYYRKNSDLFLKHFSLGAWFDKRCAKTYLDISAPIPLEKQNEAVNLGKNANQIAGFNLFNFSEIPLGGNGKLDFSVTPFNERLKEALTLIAN